MGPGAHRRIAGRAAAALLVWACAAAAPAAQVVGTVVQLSGPMAARSAAGGAGRPLALKSEVEGGDTLVTEPATYAKVRFIDDSELTLKPGTTVTIDQFSFDSVKPAGDSAGLTLVKGGLRSVSGLLGQRSKEKFVLKTPNATIGIRGTIFVLEFIAAPDAVAASPGLAAGLHVFVKDGGISLTNQAGVFLYDTGQFGYFQDDKTKPVKMTANPGMQFAPPASFRDGAVFGD